eukprot:TRINITY_DN22923_c0_g1_i1.p1 TRINITY_DN22923_c0_g1~~TRINITY_DN22923_c0_g1_i1.p1  ORF type:complete len:102 (-),score=4.06 TRINITY_DN22923_c0_g1_i1:191-496(-)
MVVIQDTGGDHECRASAIDDRACSEGEPKECIHRIYYQKNGCTEMAVMPAMAMEEEESGMNTFGIKDASTGMVVGVYTIIVSIITMSICGPIMSVICYLVL